MVRNLIADSWRRSSHHGINPGQLEPAFMPDEIGNEAVVACVDQVLHHTLGTISNEPVSIIFAAANGHVLRRYCPNQQLANRLEKVFLAPGFGYGEGDVGTNGIGTALERGQPTMVVGGEHFSERLKIFTCAGAPVRHPVSGELLGIIDVTCRAGDGNTLLLSFAQTIASQIEQALVSVVTSRELALLRDYLSACRHATGPILAINGEVVMMNRHAQQQLIPEDRSALIARTADAADKSDPGTVIADLPSGQVVRMDYRPTLYGQEVAGGIFRVQLTSGLDRVAERRSARPVGLPGVQGTSTEWIRVTEQLRQHRARGESTIVEGEAGVGKLALASAAHHALTPGKHLRVIDCSAVADDDAWLEEVQAELDGRDGTLLLRRLDQLPLRLVGSLSTLLMEHSAASTVGSMWIVGTRRTAGSYPELEASVVPCFGHTVVVPPLRHRPEDVRAIAMSMLRTSARTESLQFSTEALRHLALLPWVGNVSALQSVIHKITQRKRTGIVEVRDLPPECNSATRRSLTPLESLERDAIVQSLRDHGGNKVRAAEHLGMSRATIYRKIRDFGIHGE